jgi:hypothetical protein
LAQIRALNDFGGAIAATDLGRITMSRATDRRRVCWAAAFLAAAVGGAATFAGTAAAAVPPPPVSSLGAAVGDHAASVFFDVPAAYYDPGAGGVVRMTVGHTPAVSPTSPGYPVAVYGRTATTTGYLHANTAYTFAVWVRDHGVYSSRRAITVLTERSFSSPLAELDATQGVTSEGHLAIDLRFGYASVDRDQTGVRVVRNTVDTTTGGTVFLIPGRPAGFVDSTRLAHGVRYYYWAAPFDTSGYFAHRWLGLSIPTT